MPYHLVDADEDVTAMYRPMPVDGATFAHGLRADLEGGPVGNLSLRSRVVAQAYQRDEPALWPCDVLDLGDPESRQVHGYAVEGTFEYLELDGPYEGEPPASPRATGAYRSAGTSRFTLTAPAGTRRHRLRRRLDAAVPWQAAEVWVEGSPVACFPPIDPNPHRRWREVDLDLPEIAPAPAGLELRVAVIATADPESPPGEVSFTAFVWELWTDVDPLLFADGFESGTTGAWSHAERPTGITGQAGCSRPLEALRWSPPDAGWR